MNGSNIEKSNVAFSIFWRMFLSFLIVLLVFAQAAFAKQVIAVLEIIPNANTVNIVEAQHITNELRRQAMLKLPQNSYMVLTRDNLVNLIPANEKEAETLFESGAIGIGKAIGANYVTQGYINIFDKLLSLSIELYETEGGSLLGNIVVEAPSLTLLLSLVREASPGLFAKISQQSPPDPVAMHPEPIAAFSQPAGGSFWTANNVLRVAAFALSAASIGVGIWQNNKMSSNDRKAGELYSSLASTMQEHGDGPEYEGAYNDYKSKESDVKFNEKLRNGFYVGAGVFGVGGMATFFF